MPHSSAGTVLEEMDIVISDDDDDGAGTSAGNNNTRQPTGNDAAGPRRNPKHKRHGRNRCYEDSDADSTDEELRPYDSQRVPAQTEKCKIAANPPIYTILKRPANWRNVQNPRWPCKCNGCGIKFADKLYEAPLNLVFRFRTIREWYTLDGKRRQGDKPGNAYYHSCDLACLARCPELENITCEDLYIEEACFVQLTDARKALLRKRKHWNAVCRNRAALIEGDI